MSSPSSRRRQRALKGVPTAEVKAYAVAKDFGRVPSYLRETMEVLEDEREYIEALPEIEAELLSEDPSDKRYVRLLTEMERLGLMEALLAKQEQVEECFESELDIHPEELWKRKVRERYEPQLRQIDRDLE